QRCMLGSFLPHSLSQYFPIRVPSLASHVPNYSVLGFPIWHIFMPGVVLVIAQSSHQTSSKKKVGSTIAREQSPINMPRTLLSIARQLFPTEFGRKCPKQGYASRLCSLFSLNVGRLSTWSLIGSR